MSKEVWRDVVGYEGKYEVSDHGRIRSLWFINGKVRQKLTIPRILSSSCTSSGYPGVSLRDGRGNEATRNIHSLVLIAFCGPRPSKSHVAGHRDGNPQNNHLRNLAWITYKENEEDKRRHGRMLDGTKNHQAKLTEQQVLDMRAFYEMQNPSFKELGARFGISNTVAHKIIRRLAWKHV